jgi:hypothetical protein
LIDLSPALNVTVGLVNSATELLTTDFPSNLTSFTGTSGIFISGIIMSPSLGNILVLLKVILLT